MKKSLIVVESPTKIKTLKKFLKDSFVFSASLGHIKDLPTKGFGIDVENNFEPQYEILADKKEIIANIKKMAKDCDIVYLSPDPDREGEAIAWHIASLLPPETIIKRVSFNAITKNAVLHSLDNPREIDMDLVDAQQARRLLDRIVGYKISPLLIKKLQQRSGVSAGRVQSAALKLVVTRENEIDLFVSTEYWTIRAQLKDMKDPMLFSASLYSRHGLRWEKEPSEGKNTFTIGNEELANTIVNELKKAAFHVEKTERKEKRRYPSPPFITSTLQQEASRHFRFSSSRTMSIAQALYEGVELPQEGSTGLITYMRTDSVRSDPEAIIEARNYIKKTFGTTNLPDKALVYTSKKTAQDAHEAIRPADVNLTPDNLAPFLTKEQHSLYQLIWKRFVSSQMVPAIYDTLIVTIGTDCDILLRSSGSVLKKEGFLSLYKEKIDDESEEETILLPPLQEGFPLINNTITSDQSFTKPPPRFTEASLIKELEKSGIGRPSTYATIMNKIQRREYTVKENQRLKPTDLGKVITQFLDTNFPDIMNIGFTAEMEDLLELIAIGKKDWKDLIKDFWHRFIPIVETAEKEALIPKIDTDLPCDKCKKGFLQKIWSRSHYFYGCSCYPECDFKISDKELSFNKEDYSEETNWEQQCPNCNKEMKVKHGPYGAFFGCSGYPECKGIINLLKKGEQAKETIAMIPCMAIGCEGQIIQRMSRYGKTFFACSDFPRCDVIGNQIDTISEKYANHPKTPYEKKGRFAKKTPVKTRASKTKTVKEKVSKNKPVKEKKKRAPSLSNLLTPSKTLSSIIGAEPVTRGTAVKKIWSYIKSQNLQDPSNKRQILPNKDLQILSGSSAPINMFAIPKLLSEHLEKPTLS
ncbi:type I DNA topoisomerase [Candidatus Clavichlamydia salmonicola]|uniref:type I DNA topoisomerase n=1 Tax=Candidatus Clavichlamydia salmonicola TaxID=469812 RepID=UPI0018910E9D|nr:type I DNA topoisomerase [Candidatus Clavichlamydia salmonicola]